MNLKHKAEALLFSSGRRMPIEELSKLCKKDKNELIEALNELKKDYEAKNSSLMVVDDGNSWKITVKEEHLSLVKKIVTDTELSKTLMETLAIIAMKYPIKQCDLIKLRTNKAYDHLSELEQTGYINRQKYGRTKLIKLTPKFFEYFSLKEEELKEKFQDFSSMAKIIEEKELEMDKIKVENKRRTEEERKKNEVRGKEIDLVDDKGNEVKLDIVKISKASENPTGEESTDSDKERLGKLEIFKDENASEETLPEEKQDNAEEESISEKAAEEPQTQDETIKPEEKESEAKAPKSKIEEEVDKRVDEILNKNSEDGQEKKDGEEPEDEHKEKTEE